MIQYICFVKVPVRRQRVRKPGGIYSLKDSIISGHIVPSLETKGKTYFVLRNKLETDGTIVDRKFTKNYEFSAPSAASAVVLGHSSNGNIDWKQRMEPD